MMITSKCDECGADTEAHVGQRHQSDRLTWSLSIDCQTCGARVEGDGVDAPDDVRAAILTQEGRWALDVEIGDGSDKWKVAAALRSILGLTMAQTSTLKALLPGQVATGTRAEMERCRLLLAEKGVVSHLMLLEAGTMKPGSTSAEQRGPCVACGERPNIGACARCGALVCEPCRAPEHCGGCAFDVTREVLAGRRVASRRWHAKSVRALLGCGDSDINLDARGFERRRTNTRWPDRYQPVLAPFAVGELLDRSKLTRLEGPTVAALRKAPIPGFASVPEVVDLCAWFVPEADALRVLLRQRVDLPAAPQPIPLDGPFTSPDPLLPWSPPAPAYLEEVAPRACPHCGTGSTRFRDLGNALVCLACGRSFAT